MVLLFISFFLAPVFADDCTDGYNVIGRLSNKCEPSAPVSSGAGIVAPSNLATIGENPVGFAFNRSFKLHGAFSKPQFGSPTSLSLAMAGGGNNLGAGLSIQDGLTSMGAAALAAKMGMGFSFRPYSSSRFIDSRYPVLRSKTTLGTLFNPMGRASLGITIQDAFRSSGIYGLGVSTRLSSTMNFILDNMFRFHEKMALIKPGFAFRLRQFQLSIAGNLPINSSRYDWSNDVVTASLAFWNSEKYKFVAHYNRTEVFYAGLTVKID